MSFPLYNIAISQGVGESPAGFLIRQASNAVKITPSGLAAILSLSSSVGSEGVGAKARFAGVEGETPITFADRLSF